MKKVIVIFLIILFFKFNDGFGWVYPEHRDITLQAVKVLHPKDYEILNQLWMEARRGNETRLTANVIDPWQSVGLDKLDFAAWPAIAGDHSCSPENLLDIVLNSDWIIPVAEIAAELKLNLAEAEDNSEIINALRDSDIKFQRADKEYATRAGSNNVHFLLARPDVNTTAKEYLTECIQEGSELNALGVYTYFHTSALYKAAKYFSENLTDEERAKLILSAIADEAFALHFLEDVFASGHTAGTWGNASQRKGTHDYYNERGLEVSSWDGRRIVLMGDAYMREFDLENSAQIIKISLEQFINAATGNFIIGESFYGSSPNEPNKFNVCYNNFMPSKNYDPSLRDLFTTVLVKTPVPGLASGIGELPRFRSELGPFLGIAPALRGLTVNRGFADNQKDPGALAGLDITLRMGYGLDGVLNESGDGLIFFDIGWRQDGPASMSFGGNQSNLEGGQITSAIPGRDALNMRLRIPFFLVPLDLLITAPILSWAAPKAYTSMAVIAGNGGLIPWQSGIATLIGRFQFILGREVGVALYGGGDEKDALIVSAKETTQLLNYKSVQISLPILEYRPLRSFSIDQSSSLIFQFEFGIDIPYDQLIANEASLKAPELRTIYFIGLRTALDWRYYL